MIHVLYTQREIRDALNLIRLHRIPMEKQQLCENQNQS